jgi:subtilisin-like proprotein convertase family protein
MNVTDTHKILDLNVTLNISHPNLAELKVYLRGPDGTRIELVSGLKGSNLVGTTLDDEAVTSILTGTAPYTGSFRPTGALSAFDGKQLNGTWTLEIVDNKRRNAGTLNSWSLTVQWGSAMTAASFASASAEAGPAPTLDEVITLADAALERWYSNGAFSAELLARIDQVRFEIVDLPGQMLAFTTWDVIYIDASAAGFGWFIDPAPQNDDAFATRSAAGILTAADDSAAYGRMDLLTVIGHEIGNLLGLQDRYDSSGDLMSATLQPGTRLELTDANQGAHLVTVDQQMIMARAAAAWAGALAHDAGAPAFSSLWMPGVFFAKPFQRPSMQADSAGDLAARAERPAALRWTVEILPSSPAADSLLGRFLRDPS